MQWNVKKIDEMNLGFWGGNLLAWKGWFYRWAVELCNLRNREKKKWELMKNKLWESQKKVEFGFLLREKGFTGWKLSNFE